MHCANWEKKTQWYRGPGAPDAGVHALGQVAHADLQKPWTPFRLMEAMNAHLRQDGQPVAILNCETDNEDFHARFSAIQRHYVYRIISRRAPLTVERGRAWNVKTPLDTDAMGHAAKTASWRARFHNIPLNRMPGQISGQNTRHFAGHLPVAARG